MVNCYRRLDKMIHCIAMHESSIFLIGLLYVERARTAKTVEKKVTNWPSNKSHVKKITVFDLNIKYLMYYTYLQYYF